MKEVRVHFVKTLIPLALVSGCASSWTGDPFDNRFSSTPHWQDCDGDGLGDGRRLQGGDYRPHECIDPDGSDAPPCEASQVPAGVTPKWVQNSRDCDDSYEFSGGGGRNGAQCPSDFATFTDDGEITSSEYQVVNAGGKDFLIVRDNPMSIAMASTVCEQWRQGAILEDNLPTELDVEVLATLNTEFEQGRVIDNIQTVSEALGRTEPWVGWVGVTTTEIGLNDWAWNVTGEGVTPELTLGFCSGAPPEPLDILAGVSWVDSDGDGQPDVSDLEGSNLAEQFDSLRLVMVVDPDEEIPCLTWASDPAYCPDQAGCFADFICERPTLNPQDFKVFELDEADSCVTTEVPPESQDPPAE